MNICSFRDVELSLERQEKVGLGSPFFIMVKQGSMISRSLELIFSDLTHDSRSTRNSRIDIVLL